MAKRNLATFKIIHGKQFKSCPNCSRREGAHVYYPIEAFGERQIRPGVHIPQSWCSGCRHDQEAAHA